MIAIDFPFRIANGRMVTTSNYDRVVRNQVIDALVTNEGERLMRPQWGCNIQAALFAPSDELVRSDVATYTQERLGALLPRASVRDVVLKSPGPGGRNVVTVGVSFKASQFTDEQAFELELETGDGAV